MKSQSSILSERKKLIELGELTDLRTLVDRSYSLYGKKELFSEQLRGRIVRYTAKDVYDDVYALGTALIDLGLSGKHIALVGENSYNWIISYLAVICGVGVILPIDKELTRDDIAHLLELGDADAVLCSRTYQRDIEYAREHNPRIGPIIVSDSINPGGDCLSFPKLVEKGRRLLASGDRRFVDAPIDCDKCSAILFTSGTTGANKGVMLSQRNITANVNSIIRLAPINPPSFSMLPFNHSYEFNCEILPAIYLGAEVYICSSLKRVLNDMQTIAPSMTIVVPLFLDTIYNKIIRTAEEAGLGEKLQQGIRLSKRLMRFHIDLRKIIFRSVRDAFGGNFGLIICGGAPANEDMITGLNDIGIDIMNGYGITECSPLVTLNTNTIKDPTSVGPAVPGVQIRIDDPDSDGVGEVLVKGNNVMLGYYKDDASTAASFIDGWFRTGDYGMISPSGVLTLTGRKKNLIILDNGKNVHPEEIEQKIIKALPYVKEAVVYATAKKQLEKQTDIIAAALHIDFAESFPGLTPEDVEREVANDMRKFNRTMPTYKQVRSVVVTEEEFVKTTTKKIKRQEVIGHHENSDRIKI